MKTGIILTAAGAALVLSSVTYVGWRLEVVPPLAWETGMVTWSFISLVVLYGLTFLIPGAILSYFGIKRLRRASSK